MRHVYYFVLVTFLLAVLANTKAIGQMGSDSVEMGFGYSNDIYYNMETGLVSSVERTNWDIGFYTNVMSAGIITNDGAGVELWVYGNGDTTNWNSIDTLGLSSWPVLYNSTDNWEEGAFNRNELGHPDYGWGVYVQAGPHPVIGDSLFIIKLMDGFDAIYKKIWIEKKVSTENTYYFKYADLNGENEVSVVLNCGDYTNKNFVYYSLQTNEVADREPNKDTWDIVFTKYNVILEGGSPYIVTGVLNNVNVSGNGFEMASPNYSDWTAAPMDTIRETVGYNWKDYDFTSGWIVFDSTVFFVTGLNGNVYKLRFTGFEGMSTGKIVFDNSLASLAGISILSNQDQFSIYPNPASNYVVIESKENCLFDEIVISDIRGKSVYQSKPISGKSSIAVDHLNDGLYFVLIRQGKETYVQKLIIGK